MHALALFEAGFGEPARQVLRRPPARVHHAMLERLVHGAVEETHYQCATRRQDATNLYEDAVQFPRV